MNHLAGLLAQGNDWPYHDTARSVIIWILVGLIAALLARKIVRRRHRRDMLDLIISLAGASVAGLILHSLGYPMAHWLVSTVVVAVFGAVVTLIVYHRFIQPA